MTAHRSAARPSTPDELRASLTGVRALLLDLDGVLLLKGRLLPGAAEALAELDRRSIPYRIVTNTSLVSRAGLARASERLGAPIRAERIINAVSASAAYTKARYPRGPIFVLTSDDARTEFNGQPLISSEDADRPDARAAAVIVGDGPDSFGHRELNRAFRLVRAGAELIGMHRNPWWLTPEGPTLDSGAMVVGLEFATDRHARILGKPSPEFFREAAGQLGAEIRSRGEHRLLRDEIAMVGDDLRSDILAARLLGLRGILVLTGKHGLGDVDALAARRAAGPSSRPSGRPSSRRPDAIAASILEVVSALS